MLREEKVQKVKALEEVFTAAKGAYLANFSGMSVELVTELRRRCRAENVRVEVAKNTFLRRAAQATQNEALVPYMQGPSALVTSTEDEVTPARVLTDFRREFKFPEVRAGLIDGKALDKADVKRISSLPPRDQLLGLLLRTMQAPLANLVSQVTSPLRDLVGVLNAVAEQKGKAS
jgi:large subunit ribosomal protein L10